MECLFFLVNEDLIWATIGWMKISIMLRSLVRKEAFAPFVLRMFSDQSLSHFSVGVRAGGSLLGVYGPVLLVGPLTDNLKVGKKLDGGRKWNEGRKKT